MCADKYALVHPVITVTKADNFHIPVHYTCLVCVLVRIKRGGRMGGEGRVVKGSTH